MKKLLVCVALATTLAAPAVNIAPSDSVWLRPYIPEGKYALHAEWSVDGSTWHDATGPDVNILSSDFGAWGSHKKMYDPELSYDPQTGLWTCRFYVTDRRQTVGEASSPDLIEWLPQSYRPADEVAAPQPKPVRTVWRTVKRLRDNAELQRLRAAAEKQTCALDAARFAGLGAIDLTITPQPDRAYDVSDMLVGIFFEDINYAADGGLYGELLQNRDFEYSKADKKRWHSTYGWAVEGEGSLNASTVAPLLPDNPTYATFSSDGAASLVNYGWNGIPVRADQRYDFAARIRGGKVLVELVAPDNSVLASAKVSGSSRGSKATATLRAAADCDSAKLRITPLRAGSTDFDFVSLFPQSTFKNRKNGLRRDLAEALDSLHPRFVRFPGGCVAHGNGVDNIYDWKGSIGPLESRRPLPNLWGYHQTRGLGYYEYFLFCEDIGAEPLPVLAAGVPCQNSSHSAYHSHNELTSNGQQGGIPMEDMQAYIQDIFDLIEWANGDPKTNPWARKRAEAGHPAPFNLKYLGIGNEDMITEVFEERFAMIFNAVRERYPEITVVGTVGPFHSGADYEQGYRIARQLGVPMVDEHYYVSPGWMLHNRDFYDSYDRNGPKVYLGEYAAHNDGRTNTVETALSCALWLTDVERNGDIVAMTSYAPLFSKRKHTQWRPDLIYFTNNDLELSTDYYVQQAFGRNPGARYIPVEIAGLPTDSIIRADKIGAGQLTASDIASRFGCSLMTDPAGGYILKLVNLLPVPLNPNLPALLSALHTPDAASALRIPDAKDTADKNVQGAVAKTGASEGPDEAAQLTVASVETLYGDPSSKTFTRTTNTTPDGTTLTLPAYSLTLLHLK